MEEKWSAVDDYISEKLLPADPLLDAVLEETERAGLPSIQVSPAQGKLLMLMALSVQSKRILEIGTLAGYSTIWMARALPSGGKLITLESENKHAVVARKNFQRADVENMVELKEGLALDTLAQMADEKYGPFDFTFIDADKENIPQYFTYALRMSRPGSLIIVDNVVRRGAVIEENSSDPNVKGVRRLHEMLSSMREVDATTIQTVGQKGYDGFTYALVKA